MDPISASDPSLRRVKESDASAIAGLFRARYPEGYPRPEVFDGMWVNGCIYNDDIICLVLEESGRVIGTGALILDVGDTNDQLGELGRFAIHSDSEGKGQGQRIINGLFEAARDNVEFAIGEARTAHLKSQRMVENAGFQVLGFLPNYLMIQGEGESLILYGRAYGNGATLRSPKLPAVIPEIAALATQVLEAFGFNPGLKVCENAAPFARNQSFSLKEVDRLSLAQLARIEQGRIVEPLLFGKLSLDEGHSFARRRNAVYLMAVDETQQPAGAIGYQFDDGNGILIGLELVAATEDLRGELCAALLNVAEHLGARIIEVNVSAYDPRVQATFLDLGFKPFAYAPSMVFHGTQRLDVVKMLKLRIPYKKNEMRLTTSASLAVSMFAETLSKLSDCKQDNQLSIPLATSSASTEQLQFVSPNVRKAQEADIPEIVELFKQTYGDDYVSADVYEGKSVLRSIHNRDMIGLVYVENNRVAASVALQFDFGRMSDQVGKVSGFLVYPRFDRDWVAHSLLKSVFEAAAENLEFVLGDLIVDNRFVQDQCELAGLSPLGYLPRYWEVGLLNRGVLPYGKLLGNGAAMRSEKTPHLIPEVAELATFILGDMRLPTQVNVESKCLSYKGKQNYKLRRLDRAALGQLAQILEGRLTEPLIFGNVSLDQGYSMLKRKGALYWMALDLAGRPVGAIGLQHEKTINVVRATELVGKEPGLRRFLCEQFVRVAIKLRARVIEAEISAYDPPLQQTFFELGFKPVGYLPAKVFRGTERLDVIKMMKLNAPYFEVGQLMLTEKAARVFHLVEKGFLSD